MSVFSYIASDCPLKEVKNPNIKLLSVNQALDMGLEVHEFLLDESFDRGKADVMLWVNNEEDLSDIEIRTIAREGMDWEIYIIEKKYLASLNWQYTEERAQRLMEYIRLHLADADEIELWNIWFGATAQRLDQVVNKRCIHIDRLTSEDLNILFFKSSAEVAQCLKVIRT